MVKESPLCLCSFLYLRSIPRRASNSARGRQRLAALAECAQTHLASAATGADLCDTRQVCCWKTFS